MGTFEPREKKRKAGKREREREREMIKITQPKRFAHVATKQK